MALWSRGQRAAHAWLNPQPVAPAQAPATHENFGQAGDEYKLPVAENIPDATTDPSQIRVTPVIDPTAKLPNNGNNGTAAGQSPAPDDTDTNPEDAAPNSGSVQVQENPAPGSAPANASPTGTTPPSAPPVAESPKIATPAAIPPSVSVVPARPMPPPIQPHVSAPASSNSGNVSIPSSLKSQMASMAPDASGNKPVEAAMATIEPVAVPELTERGILADQPAIAYPAASKGQQGTVVLQVLIGRDGTVQDAKFLQGSLMFARAAIDGVKQWKFKPYLMNGRAVSVQTSMTVSFKP
jgi:protein TonB